MNWVDVAVIGLIVLLVATLTTILVVILADLNRRDKEEAQYRRQIADQYIAKAEAEARKRHRRNP